MASPLPCLLPESIHYQRMIKMKLIELNYTSNKAVLVNPEKILYITEIKEGARLVSQITFDENEWMQVIQTYSEIVEILAQAGIETI